MRQWIAIGWVVFAVAWPGALRLQAAPGTVVSLSPSITEMVFLFGEGKRLVGVTRYCRFPEAATRLPDVGGFLDPNIEAILRLQPAQVLLLTEHRHLRDRLEGLGLATVMVHHSSVRGILESAAILGGALDCETEAMSWVKAVESRMEAVAKAVAGSPRPSVMVILDRPFREPLSQGFYVAGINTFYHDLIEAAGGRNVLDTASMHFAGVNRETLLRLNPEVIVECIPGIFGDEAANLTVQAAWRDQPILDAVRGGRVHVLTESYTVSPGPRFILFLEAMAALLHPGVFS